MAIEFLTPVAKELQQFATELDDFTIGKNINFTSNIQEGSIILIGVKETRGSNEQYEVDYSLLRKSIYQLKKGDWQLPMVDLGDLEPGKTLEDTYFAFTEIQQELVKQKATVVILGGSSDLIYYQYRALGNLLPHVNVTCIDNQIRLGNNQDKLSPNNYLSKIITEKPHQLFEYTHLAYQTYFVAQEELDLMEELNFEFLRLGKLIESIAEAEPPLRLTDMLALNLDSLQSSDFKSNYAPSPNGLSAREICALTRYAGLNNKVKTFGLYNYVNQNKKTDALLLSQAIWYFIEGKNNVVESVLFNDDSYYEKFHVQLPEQDLVFYHNKKTQQWWLELKELKDVNEEGKHIIPCSQEDYKVAMKGDIPNRWWKSYKKLY